MDNDSASVIVSKDSTSVIASERSERGNLLLTHCSVDCHEFSLFDKSLNSRNDDGRVDCHESASTDSRNDGKQTNPQKYIKLAQVDSIRTDSTQIDSRQMDSAQNDSNQTESTNATAESTQIDSAPQAFDKPSRYNKLKSKNDLESTNLQAKDLGKVSVSATTGFDLPLKEEVKNVIIIDKEDLQNKGYTNLEDALAKQPFISFIAGPQGTKNIDIRGQGLDASRAVKLLVNRVPINLQDVGNPNSAHGNTSTAPFNHIPIETIESIEIIPGGGSVIYGGGTRGGVVNIVTKKPSKDFTTFSLRGSAYENNNPLSLGGGVGVSEGKTIGKKVFVSASADYDYQNGLRPSEYTNNLYTAFQTIYQIAPNHKLDFNISYSKMWRYFAGYSSRIDCTTIGTICTNANLRDYNSLKSERYTSPSSSNYGSENTSGEVTQDFIQTSLNYNAKFSENLAFDALTFYQFSNFLFPSQELGGNTRNTFSNQGAGLNLKIKHKIPKNTLIVGLDNQVELSDNLAKSSSTNLRNKGQKYSTSLYVFDTMKFIDWFSLGLGARGDFSYFMIQGHTGMNLMSMNGYFETNAQKPQFGYAAEITPAFHYGDSGVVYIKGELGYISPSVRQVISSNPNYNNTTATGVAPKVPSDIKPEQYFTGEIGWREYFKNSSLSASVFYTHTLNEIRHKLNGFTTEYFNIGQTQRLGVELSAKHSFFGDILNLSESVTYLYTNVLKGRESVDKNRTSTGAFMEGKPIPYAPLFKATLFADVKVFQKGNNSLALWLNNSYNGNQVDSNQIKINKDYGYVLSDMGVNYRYKDEYIFTLSAGVRNVFDTFYIAYQSTSVSSTSGNLTGGTYLAGAGRSYFVDMRLNF